MASAIPLKTLEIDWADLEIAYRDSTTGIESFLDRETGEVVTVFDRDQPEWGLVRRQPERYLRVPGYRCEEARAVLRGFVQQLHEGETRSALEGALQSPAALSRCSEILAENALLLDDFAHFEERAIYERLMLWLGALGICAEQPPPFAVCLALVGLRTQAA
ncbi:MAG: UPF0158 family protein [Pseudomonadota bacterium]